MSSKRAYVPSLEGLLGAYLVEPADPAQKLGKAESELAMPAKPQTEAERRANIRVKQKATAPVFCQSFGGSPVQPLVTRDDLTSEYVVWPTDRGYLNLGRISHDADSSLVVKYRLTTGAPIVARPAYLPPDPKTLGDAGVVFATSSDGFVYAVQEESGETLWRFSTGEPIVESPVVIDDHVYVTTQLGGMYVLDTKTGKSLWWAENVARFAAASKTRVYATDCTGHLVAFSAASGAKLDSIPTEGISKVLANPDTDRLYLVSNSGLIQCLREAEQTEPLVHNAEQGSGESRLVAAAEERGQGGKAEERIRPTQGPHGSEGAERATQEGTERRRKLSRRGEAGRKPAATTSAIRAISLPVHWARQRAGAGFPTTTATIHSKSPP